MKEFLDAIAEHWIMSIIVMLFILLLVDTICRTIRK